MKTFLLLLPLPWLLAGCAQNPVTGNNEIAFMTEAEELEVGRREDHRTRAQFGVYQENPGLQAYVNRVGQALARVSHRPKLKITFTILDTPVVNAFALPGFVYITRGLLAHLNSEDELAAVLGHEIGHVTARHTVQKHSADVLTDMASAILSIWVPDLTGGAAGKAIVRGYSREMELEADRLALEYLNRAGYDPRAVLSLLNTLRLLKQNHDGQGREGGGLFDFFATHPEYEKRLEQLGRETQRGGTPGAVRGDFLGHLEGLPFGGNVRNGFLSRGRFYFPDQHYSVPVPAHWHAVRHQDRLLLQSQDREVSVEIGHSTVHENEPRLALARILNVSPLAVTPLTLGGSPAAQFEGSRDDQPFQATQVLHDRRSYLLLAMGKTREDFERQRANLDALRAGFAALPEAEAQGLPQPRLALVEAPPGSTYGSLARSAMPGKAGEKILRLLNGAGDKDEPAPGQKVKIIKLTGPHGTERKE